MLSEISYIIILYFVFSITEWLVHKYIMHGDKDKTTIARDHVIHHIHTLPTMKLVTSDTYGADIDKYLGLYFTWKSSIIVFCIGIIEGFMVRNISGFHVSNFFIIIIVSILCVYQSSFWNTIHPDIHYITTKLSWREGIPGWNGWKYLFGLIPIQNSNLYEWLKQNHRMHHLRKGVQKGNFNVTLPGADFIFGSYYN